MRAFLLLLVVGLAAAAPTSNEEVDDTPIVVDKTFYPKEFLKHKSDHDIVSILVPINSLNFEDTDSSESKSDEKDSEVILFFVEADISADGKRDYRGLYVMKDGKTEKLLDNGVEAAASGDDSKLVFFAATDGIYVYKQSTNTAEKYGQITDNVIGIAKEKTGDVLYILTADHEVFKVSDNGNVKTKVADVADAQQIVLDYSNNLYYYTSDKNIFAVTPEGVKKINGLPENPKSITLVRPPFLIDDSVPAIVDNVAYLVFANGTSDTFGVEFSPKAMPTAFGMDGALIQYYGYDKSIYEYNVLAILLGDVLEELKNYLSDKADTIRSLSTNTRSAIQNNIL